MLSAQQNKRYLEESGKMANDYIVKDIALRTLAARSWILLKLKCRALCLCVKSLAKSRSKARALLARFT